ncbi:MAG: PaaI family thioesterase [Pseudomonadota bacterium]|nr:PaaI family thioesterase [Pseudomonadota bacterium]
MSTFSIHIPFVEMLGFELVACDAGQAEIALTLREELTNSRDMAHGGVSMTLLDVAMAHAARSPNQAGQAPETHGVVTIEMKTTFMRPAVGRLRALGSLVHRTASMAFCEGRIVSDSGAVVAQATGTFKYVKALPGGSRRKQPLDTSD